MCTGGTIDKTYPRAVGGYAFEFGDEPAVERILRIVPLCREDPSDLTVVSVCSKDSTELSAADREALRRHVTSSAARRFVCTHGTDTMIATGEYLDAACKERGAVVVLCGASKPERFVDSDAAFNVGFAMGACRALERPGAYIAMNGHVLRVDEGIRRTDDGKFVRASSEAKGDK